MWYIQCQELFHIDRNDNYVIRSICMDSVGILFQTILTILKTNGRKFCPALEYSFVLIQWNVGLANCNWGLAKCRPRRSRANNRTPTLSIQTGYRDSDSGTSYCSLLDKKVFECVVGTSISYAVGNFLSLYLYGCIYEYLKFLKWYLSISWVLVSRRFTWNITAWIQLIRLILNFFFINLTVISNGHFLNRYCVGNEKLISNLLYILSDLSKAV